MAQLRLLACFAHPDDETMAGPLLAHYGGESSWATVRPPLVELTATQQASLVADLDRAGFTMPGLKSRSSS